MSLSEMRSKGDEIVEQFLKDAGIDENSPIDPASRQTLRELLLNTPPADDADADAEGDEEDEDGKQAAAAALPPVPQVNTSNTVLQRHVSELSDFEAMSSLTSLMRQRRQQQHASTASTAGSLLEHESKEDRLLRLIQQQTSMIVDLHQRMEELTQAVLQQQQQQQPHMPAATWTAPLQQQQQQPAAAAVVPPPPNAPHNLNDGNLPVPVVAAEQQQHRPHNFLLERWQRFMKIVNLFLVLRRRHVPNLDGGLIFKVCIMLAILLSRVNRRRKRESSSSQHAAEAMWDYRFYALIVVVVGGFLLQSGFIKFLYIFFVKENYAGRIWEGEDIDPDNEEAMLLLLRPPRRRAQQQQPQPAAAAAIDPDNNEPRHPRLHIHGRHEAPAAVQPQQALQEEAGFGWRDTFLGGVIARHENMNNNGPLRWIQDVGFFIGSFFLSIFPMWRPEAPPAPIVVDGDNNDQAADNENPANDDDNDDFGLPNIRPPRDAMEAAEEDDDNAAAADDDDDQQQQGQPREE